MDTDNHPKEKIVTSPIIIFMAVMMLYIVGVALYARRLSTPPTDPSKVQITDSQRNDGVKELNGIFDNLESLIDLKPVASSWSDYCRQPRSSLYTNRCVYTITRFYGFSQNFRIFGSNLAISLDTIGWTPKGEDTGMRYIMDNIFASKYAQHLRGYPNGYFVGDLPTSRYQIGASGDTSDYYGVGYKNLAIKFADEHTTKRILSFIDEDQDPGDIPIIDDFTHHDSELVDTEAVYNDILEQEDFMMAVTMDIVYFQD